MTPEELIRKRKRDELLKRANATQPTTPTDGEQLVSENTKETLKAAGHWAGVIGKRAAELTQKGVAVAAEKAREAKATVDAKRASNNVLPSSGVVVSDGMNELLSAAEETLDANPTIAGEGEPPLGNLSQQDVADTLSVQSDSDSLLFEAAETLARRGGSCSPSALLGVANELGAGDTRVTDGVDFAPTFPSVFTDPADSSSAVPEGSSQPPEAASVELSLTPSQPGPRSRWPWIVGGVVAVALVAGATYVLQGKNDQSPPSAPAPVAPVATPAVPEQLPEVMEAPVVAPAPAVLPEQARPEPTVEKPQPVAAPVVTAPAPIATQSMPSRKRASAPLPKKAPAPAAAQKNEWQQKASNDLDAWAEKSGIK